MALLTDLNHTILKVDHYVKETSKKDTTTVKLHVRMISQLSDSLNNDICGLPSPFSEFLGEEGGGGTVANDVEIQKSSRVTM